jgi:hypothetical protein
MRTMTATMKTLRFGIEIETVGLSKELLARAIQSVVGGTVSGWGGDWSVTDARGRTWKVESDASLSSHSNSGEIVSPILAYEDLDVLHAVVRAVHLAGARADYSTGIHVHVDALAFGGFSRRWGGAVATIVPSRGAQVEGLLYRLTPKEIFTLDRYEGCPTSYQRLAKMVTDEHGRRRRAEVYVQPHDGLGLWAPPPRYTQVIRRAYRQFGFDTGPLAAAIEVAR